MNRHSPSLAVTTGIQHLQNKCSAPVPLRTLGSCLGRLREFVDAAKPLGSGIGGKTVLLEVDGTPFFVKQLRLTDLERRPENVHPRRICSECPPSASTVSASSVARSSAPGGSWPCTP